jgi:Skp family chaperone for outer membrane proteins
MRRFLVVVALSLVLATAPGYAAPMPQAAPAAQAPASGTQKPATPPPPAPAPATQNPAAPAPPAAPTLPKFQDGLKYAFLNLQVIAANSNEGKALSARVQALQEQKAKELQDKNKQLQAAQDKLEKGGSVMSDQARQTLQLDIERQQRDIQRSTEDAQQDLQTLTQQLQVEFERKLTPVLDGVAKQKGIHFIFNAGDSGLVWADPSLDLTGDVLQALDAATKTGK